MLKKIGLICLLAMSTQSFAKIIIIPFDPNLPGPCAAKKEPSCKMTGTYCPPDKECALSNDCVASCIDKAPPPKDPPVPGPLN